MKLHVLLVNGLALGRIVSTFAQQKEPSLSEQDGAQIVTERGGTTSGSSTLKPIDQGHASGGRGRDSRGVVGSRCRGHPVHRPRRVHGLLRHHDGGRDDPATRRHPLPNRLEYEDDDGRDDRTTGLGRSARARVSGRRFRRGGSARHGRGLGEAGGAESVALIERRAARAYSSRRMSAARMRSRRLSRGWSSSSGGPASRRKSPRACFTSALRGRTS
jgi:hypothetical protein